MGKPSIKCAGCGTKIFFETAQANLSFECKSCGQHISVDIPFMYRSTFRIPHDPVLVYEEPKKPTPNSTTQSKPTTPSPKPPVPKPAPIAGIRGTTAYIRINTSDENEMRRYLQLNYPELLVDCPSMETGVDYVLKRTFVHDTLAYYVITNNSYYVSDNQLVESLSIRTVVSHFLRSRLLDGDRQLRISGTINAQGIFVVNRLDIVRDSPLMFNEQKVKCRIFHGATSANNNCLRSAVYSIPTYSKEMQDELSLWSQYLDWKQKLAEIKIRSAKYIAVRVLEDDAGPTGISFLAVAPDKTTYEKFVKTLKREGDSIAIVANNNSKNRWVFSYVGVGTKADRETLLPFESVSLKLPAEYLWEEATEYLHKDSTNMSVLEAKNYIRTQREAFPNPVFFEVSFGFASEDLAIFDRDEMSGEDIRDYIYKKVLSRINADGFIATSRLGDFLLNSRLKNAVSDLSKGRATSGNLGNWIFDITKARVATKHYDELQWSPWGEAHLNDSQKQIVKEMLAAPDVYLCQGPPGTGKTTVISEIVYQLAIRNKRVLIASQTNLAVNNALSRLLDYPGIRAIRLGAERKLDETVDAISEQNILQTFFSRIKNDVERKYIVKWDVDDAKEREIEQDLVDANCLAQSLSDEEKAIRQLQNEQSAIGRRIENILSSIEENYVKIEQQKDQMLRFAMYANALEKFSKPEGTPFLDSEQANQLYQYMQASISDFADRGYRLLPAYTDINRGFKPLSRKEINYAVQDIALFFLFIHSCQNATSMSDNGSDNTQALLSLQIEIRELEENDEISFEEFQKLQKLKKTVRDLQNGNCEDSFPICFLKFLPNELSETLKNSAFTGELKQSFISDTGILAENGLKALISFFREYVEQADKLSAEEDEELNRLRRQENELSEKLLYAQANREAVRSRQNTLAAKYGCVEKDLISSIQLAKRTLKADASKSALSRPDFEPFLREFVSHIEALGDDYSMENAEYLKNFINACNVVGISCTESSYTLTQAGFNTFDVAIIDEVSKATPPELLIPLLLAEKSILVGDHRQLPPLFGEHDATYYDYIQDIDEDDQETKDLLSMSNYKRFEELVTNSLFKRHYEQANPANKGPLLKQYRMHREIMDVVNMFYDGKLDTGIPLEEEQTSKAHYAIVRSYQGGVSLVSPEHHAYWIDSSSLHGIPAYETQAKGSSKYNKLEAVLIAKMVQQLDDSYYAAGITTKTEIGIISFYAAQVRLIRQEIAKRCKLKCISCDVNTVDRFQGKEKPIVIVSLVRNVKAGKKYDASYVKAYQRINVAVSRAQNLLLLVGAKDMYINQEIPMEDMETGKPSEPQYVYRNMIEMLNMRGCFITADDILSHEVSSEIFEL